MTLGELYAKTRRALLAQEDADTAVFLTRELLSFVTGKTREQLLADRQMYVGDGVCEQADALTARILAGEPLAYVIGQWEFYGLKLFVSPKVLIPRDDTCAVTELAIQKAQALQGDIRILDLCAGSGCIGLALASHIPGAKVTLADISHDALSVAKKNITANQLSARVACVQADALTAPPAFLGQFDIIVSNPPYITTEEMTALPHSVAAFEPHLALHGGEDGLNFYRAIAKNYIAALKPGGYLCFEFGAAQGDAVCALLEENGYTVLERSRDYNDRERAVIAQYDRKEA